MFELATDHTSPLTLATYDPNTGALYLEFDYDRLLDTQGVWSDARHIDAVTFMGKAYPIIIHDDDGPRDENGRYIFNKDTVDNIFTINVGAGHDPADGTLEFGLTDREDGTRELFNFQLEDASNEAPVTVDDTVSMNFDDILLFDVLANDSDPEGGALTLVDAFTETVVSIDVSVQDNKVRLDPVDAALDRIDSITYIVEDEQGARSQGRLLVDISGESDTTPDQPVLVQAVNAGGAAFTAANGVTYQADDFNNGRSFTTSAEITGTTNDPLYQSERWNPDGFTYEVAVENGTYDVALHFAEIWGGASSAGARVFDLYVEDELVFNDLDISDQVGINAALDLIGQVEVTDRSLTITTTGEVQNPKIAGFSIWEANGARQDGFTVGTLYDDLSF